ncbi:DUF4183 domain-containing protein [Paenibacillus sp. strain BS8-2]
MEAFIASCSRDKKIRPAGANGVKKCKPNKRRRLLAVRTYYYYSIGDGERRLFTLAEALPGYDCRLPDPSRMSVVNVFVDGMLQSPEVYGAYPGELLFVSNQAPPMNSRIIAQFIAIRG